MKEYKISVFGLGYVGASVSVLLSQKWNVCATDLDESRLETVRQGHSPIQDPLMETLIQENHARLSVTKDAEKALEDADYVIIAVNTPLNDQNKTLETANTDTVIREIVAYYQQSASGKRPTVVIKSTVPIGYTKECSKKYPDFCFLFCPEFLREKSAMQDMLHPSRIIIGCDERSQEQAQQFKENLISCIHDEDVSVVMTGTQEAEAIKLFSNAYLASRISFFNELDSFAKSRGLDTNQMIQGVCLDPRIGDWYNQPGPGYGGHCLPKDTNQLLSEFKGIPGGVLIRGIIESNELRKTFAKENGIEE